MVDALSLEDLRTLAQEAGLKLPDSELERILPGVQRSRRQAAELRRIFSAADEPAVSFQPHASR